MQPALTALLVMALVLLTLVATAPGAVLPDMVYTAGVVGTSH